METLKARGALPDIPNVLNDHRWQPKLLYPAKPSVIIKGERKTCHDKKTYLKEFMSTKPTLQKILEGIHRSED